MTTNIYIWPDSSPVFLRTELDHDAVCIRARDDKGLSAGRVVIHVHDEKYAKHMVNAMEDAHNAYMALQEQEEAAARAKAEEQERERTVSERQMNPKEEEACRRLFDTQPHKAASYDEFRRFFVYDGLNGCWMALINGVAFGIESDGYAHQ